MGKKIIQPGEKVGLKLTQAQRSLLLEALLLIPKEVERAIRSTPVHEPLMFTLDDLEDLAGHVAAGANHAEDKALRDKLDRIYRKIEKLLGSYTDQPEPTADEEAPSSLIETLIDMIAGAGPTILPMPSRSKKGEELYPVSLTEKQREALIGATRLRRGLKNKIGEVPEGTQVVGFTRKELDETASEVDIAIGFAPSPSYKKRLEAVLGKLEDILDALQEDEPIQAQPQGGRGRTTGSTNSRSPSRTSSRRSGGGSWSPTARSPSSTRSSRSSWAGTTATCTTSRSAASGTPTRGAWTTWTWRTPAR